MNFSNRINKLPPYLFVEINKKLAEKRAKGIDIISFGIGDPDLPTPEHIINRLCSAAKDPANHRYPETLGLFELRKAISDWYYERFKVELDPDKEVLPLLGSKEGIGHISFCFIEQGDIALVTDPGYPVYSISTMLAGGESFLLPINKDNNFLPELHRIPKNILMKARLLWLNYPNNPTGAVADIRFFKSAVEFARNNNILICHDAPYSEIYYDDFIPPSILQVNNAKDCAIEFHSFSKTFNMTGWRIGMAVGNKDMIDALFRFKSNLDSGIPQAIQYMAIEALKSDKAYLHDRNELYKRRRDLLCNTLYKLGLEHSTPKAGFYIWAKVPDGLTSIEFANQLLEEANIAVTPGVGYGPNGEGYIRFSITLPDVQFDEGIRRLISFQKKFNKNKLS